METEGRATLSANSETCPRRLDTTASTALRGSVSYLIVVEEEAKITRPDSVLRVFLVTWEWTVLERDLSAMNDPERQHRDNKRLLYFPARIAIYSPSLLISRSVNPANTISPPCHLIFSYFSSPPVSSDPLS